MCLQELHKIIQNVLFLINRGGLIYIRYKFITNGILSQDLIGSGRTVSTQILETLIVVLCYNISYTELFLNKKTFLIVINN